MAQYQVKDPNGNLHVIEGPEGATPEQITEQAAKLIPTSPPSTMSRLNAALPNVANMARKVAGAAESTASFLPGLSQAVSIPARGIQMGAEMAQNPRQILPMIGGAAFAAAAPEAAIPAMGMAALGGGLGESLNQLGLRAAGKEALTSPEAAQKIGAASAEQAAYEGAARLPAAIIGSTVKGAAKRLVSADPAEAAKIMNVAEKNPEVTKPGYFKERINTFLSDVTKKLGELRKAAGEKIASALSTEGKKPVTTTSDIKELLNNSLAQLEAGQNAPEVKAARKNVENLIDYYGKNKPLTVAQIDKLSQEIFAETEKIHPTHGRAFANFQAKLDKMVDPSVAPKLAEANAEYKKVSDAAKVLKESLGAEEKLKATDIRKTNLAEKRVANRLGGGEATNETIGNALDVLGGNLKNRADKLAAAGSGEGRLSKGAKGMPTVGVGQAGYVAKNPGSGILGLSLVRGLTGLESPNVVGKLFRGVKATEPLIPAVPSLFRTGAIKARKKK